MAREDDETARQGLQRRRTAIHSPSPRRDTRWLPEWKATVAEVRARAALQHAPRKIRNWVRDKDARYEPGFGWYVWARWEHPSLGKPYTEPAELRRRGLVLRYPADDPRSRIPVEPPIDWPVSASTRARLVAERLSRLLDGYETIPHEGRDPAEDTAVTVAAAIIAWTIAICRHLLRRPV